MLMKALALAGKTGADGGYSLENEEVVRLAAIKPVKGF